MLELSEESIAAGKCKPCGAYINRFIALAMQEVRERETVEPDAWWRDDDRAWADYRDEQADRLAVARGVA